MTDIPLHLVLNAHRTAAAMDAWRRKIFGEQSAANSDSPAP